MSPSDTAGRPLQELADLTGRSAIVTGAGRVEGLGFAIANRLSESGAAVVVNDYDEDALRPGLEELRRRGHRVAGVAGDVADPSVADRAVATAVESFGRVDALVNNAAVWPMVKVLDWTRETFNRVLEVNVTAPLLWTQATIGRLLDQGSGGSIVNIISTAAQMVVIEELLGYETSKAAALHMTHGIARAYALEDIRVNNILPGPMSTMKRQSRGEAAIGRRGDPDEIARAVHFLVSDLGSYVTGADWRVDGGRWLGLSSEQAAAVRLEADEERRLLTGDSSRV